MRRDWLSRFYIVPYFNPLVLGVGTVKYYYPSWAFAGRTTITIGHHFEQGGDSSVMDSQLFNSRIPWMLGQCNPKCIGPLLDTCGSAFQ